MQFCTISSNIWNLGINRIMTGVSASNHLFKLFALFICIRWGIEWYLMSILRRDDTHEFNIRLPQILREGGDRRASNLHLFIYAAIWNASTRLKRGAKCRDKATEMEERRLWKTIGDWTAGDCGGWAPTPEDERRLSGWAAFRSSSLPIFIPIKYHLSSGQWRAGLFSIKMCNFEYIFQKGISVILDINFNF